MSLQDEGSLGLSSLKAFQNKSHFESVFFSLKHFGHLSHSCIKTHHNSVF